MELDLLMVYIYGTRFVDGIYIYMELDLLMVDIWN